MDYKEREVRGDTCTTARRGAIGKGKEGPGETYTTTGHLQPPPGQHSPLHDAEPQHEQGPILALEGLKVLVFWF